MKFRSQFATGFALGQPHIMGLHVLFALDCYDYEVSVTGASDTRLDEDAIIVYNYFDEINVTLDRYHSCDLIHDYITWRHVRFEACHHYHVLLIID